MGRFVLGLFTGVTLATMVGLAAAGAAWAHRSAVSERADDVDDTPSGPVKVYLNRVGGRVTAGKDDPARNRSEIVAGHDKAFIDIAPYGGTDRQWDRFVRCVEAQFEDFAIDIVQERPETGDYVMAWVGGRPEQLDFASTVGGVAPYDGNVLRNAVVFVFESPHSTPKGLCETAAEEIGHAMGLDHTRLCSDIMSYRSCGSKRFRDRSAPCGEWEDRACADGRAVQNSWNHLATRVGLRNSPRVVPPTARIASASLRTPAEMASTADRRHTH